MDVHLGTWLEQVFRDIERLVHKPPFHDPNFIGFFAPDSVVVQWSNAYRI
jgi:hypothetical protein